MTPSTGEHRRAARLSPPGSMPPWPPAILGSRALPWKARDVVAGILEAGDRAATGSVRRSVVSSPDQPPESMGSRSRFMVNSILDDCISRQLSTSVMYQSFGKRSKYSKASVLAVLGPV
jgi:hypothetical protein